MIKTSTRMQRRRNAGIHTQRTPGFTPVFRAKHNQDKDQAMSSSKEAAGSCPNHPLEVQANRLIRGGDKVTALLDRAIARNNRLNAK